MPASIEELLTALADGDPARRAWAAEQLSQSGDEARPAAAAALVRACSDEEEQVREWVTAALEGLGPPRIEDLDALAGLVDDPSPDSAWWAATLLGRLGPQAARIAPILTAAVDRHPNPEVRRRAAWALSQIAGVKH